MSIIIQVNVVWNRTVVVDSDYNSPIEDYTHLDDHTQPIYMYEINKLWRCIQVKIEKYNFNCVSQTKSIPYWIHFFYLWQNTCTLCPVGSLTWQFSQLKKKVEKRVIFNIIYCVTGKCFNNNLLWYFTVTC